MQNQTQSRVKQKIISTQCQTCGHNFNLTTEKIQSFSDGMTSCPSCSNPIKITFCPHCNISYSISTAGLTPNKYATKCKQCGSPFYIDIPSKKNITGSMPFITRVTKPVTAPDISKPASEPEKPAVTDAQSIVHKSKSSETREQVFTSNSLATYSKDLSASFKKSYIFLSLMALISISLIITAGSSLISLLLIGQPLSNTYITSFIRIIPLSVSFGLYTAFASLITRSVLLQKGIPGITRINNSSLFFKSLISAIFGGAPAIITISALLVYMTRIPEGGTLIFSLTFLPLYIGAIVTTILLIVGFWFIPAIYSLSDCSFSNSLPLFFTFIKNYNFRLIYMVASLFMITGAFAGTALFLHGSAITLVKMMTTAIGGENITQVLSDMPMIFASLARYSFIGENSSFLNYLSGNSSLLSSISGFILGGILTVITLVLYSVTLTFVTLTSATMYAHLKLPTEHNTDRAKKELFILLLLIYSVLIAMKIALF